VKILSIVNESIVTVNIFKFLRRSNQQWQKQYLNERSHI
jgi:hypothetical protein